MDNHGLGALAALLVPGRTIATRDPETPALPTGAAVIDTTFHTLHIEAQRVGKPQRDKLTIDQRVYAVREIAGRDRHVHPQSQGVVLIDPGVVARLDAELR